MDDNTVNPKPSKDSAIQTTIAKSRSDFNADHLSHQATGSQPHKRCLDHSRVVS